MLQKYNIIILSIKNFNNRIALLFSEFEKKQL